MSLPALLFKKSNAFIVRNGANTGTHNSNTGLIWTGPYSTGFCGPYPPLITGTSTAAVHARIPMIRASVLVLRSPSIISAPSNNPLFLRTGTLLTTLSAIFTFTAIPVISYPSFYIPYIP